MHMHCAEPFCPKPARNTHKVLDQVLPAKPQVSVLAFLHGRQRATLVTVWLITQSIAIRAAAARSSGHLLYVLLLVKMWIKVAGLLRAVRATAAMLSQQGTINQRLLL